MSVLEKVCVCVCVDKFDLSVMPFSKPQWVA